MSKIQLELRSINNDDFDEEDEEFSNDSPPQNYVEDIEDQKHPCKKCGSTYFQESHDLFGIEKRCNNCGEIFRQFFQ